MPYTLPPQDSEHIPPPAPAPIAVAAPDIESGPPGLPDDPLSSHFGKIVFSTLPVLVNGRCCYRQLYFQLRQQPTWLKAQILLLEAIITTGKRTVSAALWVMGLSDERNFAKYHHVLNRAVWSPHQASETLLSLLLHTFDQRVKPLVFGLDETIKRRWN